MAKYASEFVLPLNSTDDIIDKDVTTFASTWATTNE